MIACFPCCGRRHRICDDGRLAYGKLKEIRLMYGRCEALSWSVYRRCKVRVTEFRKAALTKWWLLPARLSDALSCVRSVQLPCTVSAVHARSVPCSLALCQVILLFGFILLCLNHAFAYLSQISSGLLNKLELSSGEQPKALNQLERVLIFKNLKVSLSLLPSYLTPLFLLL